MEILVQIKNVYGNDTIYPACAKSRAFVELLSQKTLTPRDLEYIQEIGFKVRQAPMEFNFKRAA